MWLVCSMFILVCLPLDSDGFPLLNLVGQVWETEIQAPWARPMLTMHKGHTSLIWDCELKSQNSVDFSSYHKKTHKGSIEQNHDMASCTDPAMRASYYIIIYSARPCGLMWLCRLRCWQTKKLRLKPWPMNISRANLATGSRRRAHSFTKQIELKAPPICNVKVLAADNSFSSEMPSSTLI